MKSHPTINRHDFLKISIVGATGILLPLPFLSAQNQEPERPAPLKPELVKEFIGVCHGKFDQAKEMLENIHLLMHVSNDWGGGTSRVLKQGAIWETKRSLLIYLAKEHATISISPACWGT